VGNWSKVLGAWKEKQKKKNVSQRADLQQQKKRAVSEKRQQQDAKREVKS